MMLSLDLPPEAPAQYAQLVAPAPQVQPSKSPNDRTIGICSLIENQEPSRHSAQNAIEPIGAVNAYFWLMEHKQVGVEGKLSVLSEPKHGKLEAIEDTPGGFFYVPSSIDYRGIDAATFLVEIGGDKIKVVYRFNVLSGVGGGTEGSEPRSNKKLCPNGAYWRISAAPTDGGGGFAYNNIAPFSNYVLNNVSLQLRLDSHKRN